MAFGFRRARRFRSGEAFGFLVVRRFGFITGFGLLRLTLCGSAQSTLAARQATNPTHQQQHNKALHPTACRHQFFCNCEYSRRQTAGELGR
jgi:hypothetical protein